MPYQEAYALVFYAHGMTKEEHESLQEYIAHLRNMTRLYVVHSGHRPQILGRGRPTRSVNTCEDQES